MKQIGVLLPLVLLCLLSGCRKASYLERNGSGSGAGTGNAEEASDAPAEGTEAGWYIQVDGAVTSPGVYEVPAGSRVFAAVNAAGGLTADADASALNQAEVLTDGRKITVPTVAETEARRSAAVAQDLVNINTASEKELMTLSGIGASKAAEIVKYREKNGAFSAPEDLMKIPGIKEGAFGKIKDHITVN